MKYNVKFTQLFKHEFYCMAVWKLPKDSSEADLISLDIQKYNYNRHVLRVQHVLLIVLDA